MMVMVVSKLAFVGFRTIMISMVVLNCYTQLRQQQSFANGLSCTCTCTCTFHSHHYNCCYINSHRHTSSCFCYCY